MKMSGIDELADVVTPPQKEGEPGARTLSETKRKIVTPMRAAALIALTVGAIQVVSVDHYALTCDSPALFYSGDRTFHWLSHFGKGGLDYRAPDPPGFEARFERYPAQDDPEHYPVFPSFVAAATSSLLHDKLGWFDYISAHHVGLVLLNTIALFLFCLYACSLLGMPSGIVATLVLALYPTAFGHTLNNAKDWPCAQFYGLSLLAAGLGIVRRSPKHLVAAACLLGVAFSAKLNAAFVFPTLALWTPLAYRILYWKKQKPSRAMVVAFFGAPLVVAAVFFFLWPWLWAGGSGSWWSRTYEYFRFTAAYGKGNHANWTDYSLRAFWFMTPPVVLVAALTTLVRAPFQRGERLAVWLLAILWTALPIARIAVPYSNYYDANRHFVEYIPGLAVMAGLGAVELSALIQRLLQDRGWRRGSLVAPPLLALVGLVGIVWPVVEYHPYETSYFNSMIGGLGGAQQKRLFFTPPPNDLRPNGTEGDYWSSSTRDAMEDVRALSKPGEFVAVFGQPGPYLAKKNFVNNPGIKIADWWEPDYVTAPFMVISAREGCCGWRLLREFEAERPVVKRIERGGGLIYEILGPRDGKVYPVVTPKSLYEDFTLPNDKVGKRYLEALKMAQGRPLKRRIEHGGVILYDVIDPETGKVIWAQPRPANSNDF